MSASHDVVSHEEWIQARKTLLEKEKAFTKMREELTAERQALPWEHVEKTYLFDGPDGKVSLADLFEGRSQLLVYHFMFAPEWPEGCKICSMCADHYQPLQSHLAERDVTMVTISRAPLEQLEAFKERMGWSIPWVSSHDSDFNEDYYVTFTSEQQESGEMFYNYGSSSFPVTECPGMSAFVKDDQGQVFHTYSAYARGLENFLGIYNLLDVVAKGRDEADLPRPMAWVRHRDRYGDSSFVEPYA